MRLLAVIAVALATLSGSGSVSAQEAGTTLTFTDQTWTCTQPVANLATDGLPLRVVMDYTHNFTGGTNQGFGVRLGAGCVGDGTDQTDLVLNINGDGETFGPNEDAIRVMNAQPGASNLQIEGYANCGHKVVASTHQDGIQSLGGTNITWRNFTVGTDGKTTCQGAGGALFYSGDSENMDVQGGTYRGCNHALLAGWPSGQSDVSDATFVSGYTAGDPVCAGYAISNPCDIRSEWTADGGTTSNLTCTRLPAQNPPPPSPPPPPPPPPPPDPPYEPVCAPTCDEQIADLNAQLIALNGEIAVLNIEQSRLVALVDALVQVADAAAAEAHRLAEGG